MFMNKKTRKNTGITLIALVVTIVVLLILAGISISMLTGENRNFKAGKESKRGNRKGSKRGRSPIN